MKTQIIATRTYCSWIIEITHSKPTTLATVFVDRKIMYLLLRNSTEITALRNGSECPG